MGVVTASSSAAQSPLGLSTRFSTRPSPMRRAVILSFKSAKKKNKDIASPRDSVPLPVDKSKGNGNRLGPAKKRMERIHAVSTDEASPSTSELDYLETAAKLEDIYNRFSTGVDAFDNEVKDQRAKRKQKVRKRIEEAEEGNGIVVSGQKKNVKRLSLEKRIALRKKKEFELITAPQKCKHRKNDEDGKMDSLVREYSASTDLVSLDWKKMKIPPVLPSSEHAWLFKLMEPMKAIFQVKENIQNDLGREPTDIELAQATNMDADLMRKQMQVGLAARNKLIKHNLRLVLFVINKYFQDFANGSKFQDVCQAGVKGLITAIDRFQPRRRLRLSTYGFFWIRHAIVRSMTLSSFTKVPFGLESVRIEIQKAKLDLLFELQRTPTDEEIIKRVGMTPGRYHEVMRVSKPISSLHARHAVTQEELINGITDVDCNEGNKRKQPALLRLALDDVLDSLKPKESLVIRQRYGLDGKGDRTLGEIAGNLSISREMVRKHEVKALLKLKHPARLDYLRQYFFK